MKRIIVCMKQVIDPEAPVSSFKIDPEAKRAIPPKGTPPVLNPYDENALEAALKIKDTDNAEVIVISMGYKLAQRVVKKSLAAGADELILLEDDVFEDLDSYCTAHILAAAISKIGDYDLILCGRQAADTDSGQVGSGMAEILGIPSITAARKIETGDGKVVVERVILDGYEVIEVALPALVTVSNEVGDLRPAPLAAIIAAQKKMATVWNAQDLGVDLTPLKRAHLIELFQPIHERECEFIEADNVEDAAIKLFDKLKEVKLL